MPLKCSILTIYLATSPWLWLYETGFWGCAGGNSLELPDTFVSQASYHFECHLLFQLFTYMIGTSHILCLLYLYFSKFYLLSPNFLLGIFVSWSVKMSLGVEILNSSCWLWRCQFYLLFIVNVLLTLWTAKLHYGMNRLFSCVHFVKGTSFFIFKSI